MSRGRGRVGVGVVSCRTRLILGVEGRREASRTLVSIAETNRIDDRRRRTMYGMRTRNVCSRQLKYLNLSVATLPNKTTLLQYAPPLPSPPRPRRLPSLRGKVLDPNQSRGSGGIGCGRQGPEARVGGSELLAGKVLGEEREGEREKGRELGIKDLRDLCCMSRMDEIGGTRTSVFSNGAMVHVGRSVSSSRYSQDSARYWRASVSVSDKLYKALMPRALRETARGSEATQTFGPHSMMKI